MTSKPQIILITGNMASGKSSVAQALAERLPNSVHLRGDVFRRMMVNGRAEMGFELSLEAERQLLLRYQIAAGVARRYLEAGFTVVYQDVIIGPALQTVLGYLEDLPVCVIVLCPRPEVVAARDEARGKTGYANLEAVLAFDQVLQQETPRLGYWLDSSEMNLEQTVEAILKHIMQ
jgi:predicted kinase